MSVFTAGSTYQLSPMQRGMLYHHLLAPDSGTDIEQAVCHIAEPLDPAAFRQAWERAVQRHPVLRTEFRWDVPEEPLQQVLPRVSLPVTEADLSHLTPAAQQSALEEFRVADRRRGFDLSRAPLCRLSIFRLGHSEYECLWTYHHIIVDGRSLFLLLQEVFQSYRAGQQGLAAPLAEPQPFAEHVQELRSREAPGAPDYWRQRLQGFSAPTPLVVDRPPGGPKAEVFGHREQSLRLGRDTTAALREAARERGVTLGALLQGAWAILLHRYSREEDIVFGAVRACRYSSVAGAPDMVGNFINCLPVRTSVDPSGDLIPWLQALRAQDLSLREFEQTPLGDVQNWSDCPAGTPLFESVVVFDNYLLGPALQRLGPEWANWDCRLLEQPAYPLFLYGYGEAEFLLRITYDQRRFADATIHRMLGHLRTIMEAFAETLDRPLSQVPLLTGAERRELLSLAGGPAEAAAGNDCLHRLFEDQVTRTPDAVALWHRDESLTYHLLNQRSNQLAHRLIQLGVGPETLVGVSLERTPRLLVAILAVLKAGGAYVPLDPHYPRERVHFILKDSAAAVLLTQASLASDLPQEGAQSLCLDRDWPEIEQQGRNNPDRPVAPDNLAYVIYTSGSTGWPKGVAIEHRNAGALLHWARSVFIPEETSGVLAATSICFDLSIFELFHPLTSGGRVVLVDDPLALAELPEAAGVTLVNTVPSAMAQLLRLEGGLPASVRTVNLAGEPLGPGLVTQLYQRGHVRRVYDLYGPSEDTTYSTFARRQADGPATIGRPIANTQGYILDPAGQLAPRGIPGELYLGGAGVARGYLNRPDLTQERFLPDPFHQQSGARLYRTGDLVAYLPDGNLQFLGRIDQQVKVKGYRIELGEIEAALSKHPLVREAVVAVREDPGRERQLVAYVVSPSPADLTSDALRRHLQQSLPEYMVPASFVSLDRIPMTSNGKVDRKALPHPEEVSRIGPGTAHLSPGNDLEEQLARIWRQLLQVEKVGTRDNFFDLGGNSLLIARVNRELQQVLGRTISIVQLYQFPTIELLAQALGQEEGEMSPGLQRSASRGEQRRQASQRRQRRRG